VDKITFTLSIQINKKSAVNKLQKASKTFQHLKNLIYITALEYFKQTKDIKYSASVLKDIAGSKSLSSYRRRTLSETFC